MGEEGKRVRKTSARKITIASCIVSYSHSPVDLSNSPCTCAACAHQSKSFKLVHLRASQERRGITREPSCRGLRASLGAI